MFTSMRFEGYSPRAFLIVGTEAESISREFLDAFPGCLPTMTRSDEDGLESLAERPLDVVAIGAASPALDDLSSGLRVLSQADCILVEHDPGSPSTTRTISALSAAGFHCTGRIEAGRADLMFKRTIRRPAQNYQYTSLHGHDDLMVYLRTQQAHSDFTVIDVGAAANPWSREVLAASFDMNPVGPAPLHFSGDFNNPGDWEPLLRHVAKYGRFSYCICSHTLEDLACPALVLEMLPKIADAGYVSVPSRYLESARPEGPYRGFIHHRWVLDNVDHDLVLVPKIGVFEYMNLPGEASWATAPDRFELQVCWRGGISFAVLNGDYLGPNRDAVIQMYNQFFNRP